MNIKEFKTYVRNILCDIDELKSTILYHKIIYNNYDNKIERNELLLLFYKYKNK